MNDHTQVFYEFSGFQLDPKQRILLRNGQPVTLAPKGMDTLLLLVKNSGRILEKDELMKALWPESFVEESNLAQNIFVLRKVLGDDHKGNCFIQTIPRRGYRFVASVKQLKIHDFPGNPHGSLPSSRSTDYWRQHSPFRGLQMFESDDAWLFFGREVEVEDLLLRLWRSPVLVVAGNAGCGKSSLIRAGLIPALRSGRFRRGDMLVSWRIVMIRPSAAPFDYLAEVLPNQLAPELSLRDQAEFIADCRNKLPRGGETLRNAVSALANAAPQKTSHTHILLVVDQLEELFTLTFCRKVRERYLDALLATSGWDGVVPVHLLLVLRADSYSSCLEHPGLSRCLENNLYNVPCMGRDQLRATIEKRLALAGAHAELGLIDSLLDDVGTEPCDLALLEYTLTQLWEQCGGFGSTLTNEAYSATRRLPGALSVYANKIRPDITDGGQKHLLKRYSWKWSIWAKDHS
jgi:DNA-binding winged helix-turn-helix (wHTH) protein